MVNREFNVEINGRQFSLKKCFILDQEEVVKMMIGNNSEILNTKIDGDLPIHFAARNSEHSNNFQGNKTSKRVSFIASN